MKVYELTYVPVPGLSEEEQKILQERVISALETAPSSQKINGSLAIVEFSSEPDKINGIKAKLERESQIQKYLFLKKKRIRIKARALRKAEFSRKTEKEAEKPKVELKGIEEKLDEILKD